MTSKGINANISLVQSNDSEESVDDSKIMKNSCSGANNRFKEGKIINVGNLLVNGISVQVKNILGETSNTTLDEPEDSLKNKLDGLIVDASTNDIIRGKIDWIMLKKL